MDIVRRKLILGLIVHKIIIIKINYLWQCFESACERNPTVCLGKSDNQKSFRCYSIVGLYVQALALWVLSAVS